MSKEATETPFQDFDIDELDESLEMERLVRSIRLADTFTLLFVRSNQRPQQQEIIKQLKSRLSDLKIEVIEFKKKVNHLLDELQIRLKDKNPDAVFVYGLESSMPDSAQADKSKFVITLNHSRNSFKRVLQCPLVLFLPEYAISAMLNGAPDFFSVRSGVFYFTYDNETIRKQISGQISQDYREHDALLIEERKQKIKNIEKLLAEYRSFPPEKHNLEIENRLKGKLANLFFITADYQKAENLWSEVLAFYKRTKNKESESSVLNNLAGVYDSQGKYEEAIKLLKKAINIDKQTIGKLHPDYATHLNNLARVYDSQGKYEEAIKLYKEVLKIDKQTIGQLHPNHATHLSNLALVYRSQGKYEEAIKLYKEVLKIDKQTVGKLHPDYARDLNNLSFAYDSQGKYKQALQIYQEAYQLCVKFLGENHPNTQIVKRNLENCETSIKAK